MYREDEYREAFRLFDKDGNGTITPKELGEVSRSLGEELTDAELQEMVNVVDENGNGTIDYNEFVHLLTKEIDDMANEEDVIKAFQVFEKVGHGYLSATELKRIMTNIGEFMTEKEVKEMIREINKGKEGKEETIIEDDKSETIVEVNKDSNDNGEITGEVNNDKDRKGMMGEEHEGERSKDDSFINYNEFAKVLASKK